MVKNLRAHAGDASSILRSGRSPGEGNGNPLQCSCLENPMDREAWRAAVHGVAKSQAQRSNWTIAEAGESMPSQQLQSQWSRTQGPSGVLGQAVRCTRGWTTPEVGFARRKGRPGDLSQLAWPPHRWERGHQVIQERPLNRTLSSVFHGFHLHSSSRTNARPKAAAANPVFPDFCVVFLF